MTLLQTALDAVEVGRFKMEAVVCCLGRGALEMRVIKARTAWLRLLCQHFLRVTPTKPRTKK